MKHLNTYRSNGKLLLTGEYAVLNGALSLAIPTELGQRMEVFRTDSPHIHWEAYTSTGEKWIDTALFTSHTSKEVVPLERILQSAHQLNPHFLAEKAGFTLRSYLEFPRDWGWGSSSTLISNVAQWSGTDPYTLLAASFGGSGYDIACATAQTPILYQLKEGVPHAYPVHFMPDFHENLFFIHLNQKQNSRDAMATYRKRVKNPQDLVREITSITEELLRNPTQEDFCTLLNTHERLISEALGTPTLQERLFPTFSGTIKSLGAWGGDFFLAVAPPETVREYFPARGFTTLLTFAQTLFTPKK